MGAIGGAISTGEAALGAGVLLRATMAPTTPPMSSSNRSSSE